MSEELVPVPVFTAAYVENLRRELTLAQARLARAERERNRAIAENARLLALIATEKTDAAAQPEGGRSDTL